MPKKKETIEIPVKLARLLTADKSEYKDPLQYDDAQELAKQLLKVLMLASE